MRRLLLSILLICFCCTGFAQELNCKVSVYHDKISGVDAQVFSSMEKALNDFMNSHKWTNDDYGSTEKIDCNILLNLTSNNANGDIDAYTATLSIQAVRPIFNSTYNSTIINYVDKDVLFHFSQFNPLHQFDDNQVSGIDPVSANLTAIFAWYAYIVLALDYDSYALDGGTPYLKKAQNIINNAPEGKGITGWKAVESTHNRYWITDELLNTRFHDVRSFWYTMHREGLDSMYYKPIDARNRILSGLKKLYTVNKENPSSILIQFIFNAKSDEILHILAQAPKPDRAPYITQLDAMDVADANKYNTLR